MCGCQNRIGMNYKSAIKKMQGSPVGEIAIEGAGVFSGAMVGEVANELNNKVDFLGNNKYILPIAKAGAGFAAAYFGRNQPFIKGSGFGMIASAGVDAGAWVREMIFGNSSTTTNTNTTTTTAPTVTGIANAYVIDEDFPVMEEPEVSGGDGSGVGSSFLNNALA
jgi:hypothetical protein